MLLISLAQAEQGKFTRNSARMLASEIYGIFFFQYARHTRYPVMDTRFVQTVEIAGHSVKPNVIKDSVLKDRLVCCVGAVKIGVAGRDQRQNVKVSIAHRQKLRVISQRSLAHAK